MLHVNYNTRETVNPGRFQHRGAWCGPADVVRQYLDALFTLPPEVVVRAHVSEEDSRFASSSRGVASVSQEQGLHIRYRRFVFFKHNQFLAI